MTKQCQRWCYDCGCLVTVGVHDLEGRFIYASVFVSDEEIARAIARDSMRRKRVHSERVRQARENISLGKHIGTYRKWGIDE